MNCQLIFRNVAKSAYLCQYVEDKIKTELLERFQNLSSARVVFTKEGDQIALRICLYSNEGASLLIYDTRKDAYSAVDNAVEKLRLVLSKRQKRMLEPMRHQRKRRNSDEWMPRPVAAKSA